MCEYEINETVTGMRSCTARMDREGDGITAIAIMLQKTEPATMRQIVKKDLCRVNAVHSGKYKNQADITQAPRCFTAPGSIAARTKVSYFCRAICFGWRKRVKKKKAIPVGMTFSFGTRILIGFK